VQTDGQIKTGRDVAIACLLGAEEFGFATTALVVCGCIMMRKCHNNTCPVGVATQDPRLRKRYAGKPEYVVNFFRMIAGETREYMAQLGFRSLDEMVGRSDLLDVNGAIDFWKARGLDFSALLLTTHGHGQPVKCETIQDHEIDSVMDHELIRLAAPALESRKKVEIVKGIRNTDRTTGTMLSGLIARKYGFKGLREDTITCRFKGSAGQSFGAFGAHGLTMYLEGEANDYVGKGLSGAKIIVTPFQGTTYNPSDSIICGNVLLYGAVEGEVYIYGRAGERFCIRNSGCTAVVEGVGDHGCEYMTGGRVVVLGQTGVNFAAGMSGGIAYVLDEDRAFETRCNLDMVDLELIEDKGDIAELRQLIEKHYGYTGSAKASAILEDWEESVSKFVKVLPMEYRRVLGKMSKEDEAVEREEVVNG
jgi:glutamate synthase domain-containing protein 3